MSEWKAVRPREDPRPYVVRSLSELIGVLSGEDSDSPHWYPTLLRAVDLRGAVAVRRRIAERAALEVQGWLIHDAAVEGFVDLGAWTANDWYALLGERTREHMAALPMVWDEREGVDLVLVSHHARPYAPVDPPSGSVVFIDPRTESALLRSLQAAGWLELTKMAAEPPF